jgi:hypothetical protein
MSNSDYKRQVVRRQRIRKTTLIVGVAIGNAFNAVGFMNKEGNVLEGCAKLYNSREEFVNLREGLKAKHHLRMCSSGWNRRDTTGGNSPILQKIMAMRCGFCGLRH